jgi:MoxR-like ATPase
MTASSENRFVGQGDEHHVLRETGRELEDWQSHEQASGRKSAHADHPRGYIAEEDVIAAVNTALLLGKPLLLAGNPGTGKSQLADRIAWEFNLSPVLRFEAQSISEAQDLFYRFDLVGQLAHVQLERARQRAKEEGGESSAPFAFEPIKFVAVGPLGKGILRAANSSLMTPAQKELRQHVFPKGSDSSPRRSVVLIDEIDKASRDFPNDLLNAVERLEFGIREVRELADSPIRVSDDEGSRPIVIITSNGEREIPAPFLRRCVFCHIPDPNPARLRQIVRNRVFGGGDAGGAGSEASTPTLPKLYEDLLGVFVAFRDDAQSFAYRPGTSELVDWSRAVRLRGANSASELKEAAKIVRDTASAVAKNERDRRRLLELLPAIPDVALPATS